MKIKFQVKCMKTTAIGEAVQKWMRDKLSVVSYSLISNCLLQNRLHPCLSHVVYFWRQAVRHWLSRWFADDSHIIYWSVLRSLFLAGNFIKAELPWWFMFWQCPAVLGSWMKHVKSSTCVKPLKNPMLNYPLTELPLPSLALPCFANPG